MTVAGKVCPRCPEKGIQAASAFSPNAARRDGLQTYCRPCTRAYHVEHRAANPDRARGWERAYRERLRVEMFEAYGHECACCGEREKTFLCLDHIDGVPDDQKKDGKRIGSDKTLILLRQQGWPPGYRILCANCNLAYAVLGTCPHVEAQLERGVA